MQFNLDNPYLNVYNLNIQRELPWDTVVTVGYAGSRGVHLLRSNDVNTAVPIVRADGSLFFPAGAPRQNTAFSTIELKSSDGNSWYNAMIFELRKRWSRDFSIQSSYTFSRNIDTTQASTFFSDATNGTTTAFPEFAGFELQQRALRITTPSTIGSSTLIGIFRLPASWTGSQRRCSMAGSLAGISNMRAAAIR